MRKSCWREKWFKSSARALMLMRPMHEPKVSALDSINISASALDLNHFSSIKTYACIDLIHTRSVNTFILWLIYQLNDLKRIYLTVNNTLFTQRKGKRTHNCSRAWHVYVNEPIRTSVDKKQIIHVPGPSVIYCGKTLLALWDDDTRIKSLDKIIHFYSYFLHFTTF